MFAISEDALSRFIVDVCCLANEDHNGKNERYIRALRDIVEATGVGQEPTISEDENFLEYMQALSIGATRLFRTPPCERLTYIHGVQRQLGLPALILDSPATWTTTELDAMDSDLFMFGDTCDICIVHRPDEPLFRQPDGCVDVWTSNVPVDKDAASFRDFVVAANSIGCDFVVPYQPVEDYFEHHLHNISSATGSSPDAQSIDDILSVILSVLDTAPIYVKRLLQLRNALSSFSTMYQSPLNVPVKLDCTSRVDDIIIVSLLIAKYAPANSICRSKPTVRLKRCLALLQ